MNAAELPQGKSYVGRLTLTMRDHTQANPPKEPPKELDNHLMIQLECAHSKKDSKGRFEAPRLQSP
jgi:hypothetical protein